MASTIASESPQWAQGLNEMQRTAVDHEGGPLLIVAGAGTGKTRTLVSRLARLLEEGVAPERILLVTFSRRVAAELIGGRDRSLIPRRRAGWKQGRFTRSPIVSCGGTGRRWAWPRDSVCSIRVTSVTSSVWFAHRSPPVSVIGFPARRR